MGLRHGWVVALAFSLGCGRLGFTLRPPPEPQPRSDAGGFDAAVEDAGQQAATTADSSMPDAAQQIPLDAAAARDASDTSDTSDSGADEPMDDAGPADAASVGTNLCSVRVTMNAYVGSPHYHGTFVLQNTSKTTWTLPTIQFDLPASTYVCNDANVLPGAGWTLQSSAGHCMFTKTPPSLSLAPAAMLTFEYSSNNQSAVTEPAAANLKVYGCP